MVISEELGCLSYLQQSLRRLLLFPHHLYALYTLIIDQ